MPGWLFMPWQTLSFRDFANIGFKFADDCVVLSSISFHVSLDISVFQLF